jgi:putative NIF3 family GTP cyclohydrolase 1 type 2
MENYDMSRRSFVLGGLGLAAVSMAPAQTAESQPTAAQIVDRIKSNVGLPWRAQTVDRIVAGDPGTTVRGIATTMMATLEVLQRAASVGRNMVITHEPTFYSHQDTTEEIKEDPTFLYKRDFIREHNLVVFRFHDHWHARTPDGIAFGMTRDLGWEKNVDAQNQHLFSFPGMRLNDLVGHIRSKLNPNTMRVLGEPNLAVKKAIASWGYVSQLPGIGLLARTDVEVLIGGETREWEVVEYAQDQIASGKKKALILLGHVVSEQAGMRYCAEWLKPLVPEVPVEFIAASDPFWKS